jgi:deaminated glutathione amidase
MSPTVSIVAWETLRVALVQHASGLEPAENRALLDRLAPRDADLVVFPEAFARDFGRPGTDLSAYAESPDGPFAGEVARVAADRDATVVAGMFERTDGPPYNTLAMRGGARADYRKIHLYDSFGYRESDVLTGGAADPVVVDVAGVPVGLMTCYDLRFPELARALVDRGAEVLVVPSAWVAGERKVDHWRTLIRARAIENTVYVVAAGQPAPRYSGHSLVVDPLGDVLAEAGEGEEVVSATLDRGRLEEARRLNPSLLNRIL